MKLRIRSMAEIKVTVLFAVLLQTPSFSQKDTLTTLFEFNSPTACPWGLTYDGKNFYLSDDSLGMVYRINKEGTVLNTLRFPDKHLKCMTFYKNDLWVVNDRIVGDTTVFRPSSNDSGIYKIYSILKVDTASGTISDSIFIVASAVNTPAINFIWGIGSHESKLYVSYNGGWGPCTFEIDPNTKKITNHLCCAHPGGFSSIGASLWCIRENRSDGTGNTLCELSFVNSLNELEPYFNFDCYASDLTFDGEYIWICDNTNKKIKKLSKISTSVKKTIKPFPVAFELYQNQPNPFVLSTAIRYTVHEHSFVRLEVIDFSGKIIETIFNGYQKAGIYNRIWIAKGLPAGTYFYRLHTNFYSESKEFILFP